MSPMRMIMRAMGFFMIVIALIAFTYPMVRKARTEGKAAYLKAPLSSADYRRLSAEQGFFKAFPIRMYVSEVYRNCSEEREQLCGETAGNAFDAAICLVSKRERVQAEGCRELLY